MIFKNKRSEIEIIDELLSTAKNEAKKTRLLYKTNLCYSHFIEYLDFLMEKEFINKNGEMQKGNTYLITEKGERFLDSIEDVIQLSR